MFCQLRNVALLLVISLVSIAASGQSSRVGANLQGLVVDPSGAAIPSATVVCRENDTGQTRTVLTDAEGVFRASELPVGTYELRVMHPGFGEYRHSGITLLVGQTVHVEITLQPASARGEITVTDQPPALDVTQTTLTTNVETERIAELPVQSRNYLNFVLLAPGVASSPARSGGAGTAAATGALADSGFSFGGLRGTSNTVSIDGVDNNDEFTGASRTELSLEMVREFQVVNTGISAENGGASGGAINVVTKTGTNTFHGDAFIFLQNGALNAREPLEESSTPKPEMNRYRTGLQLCGPLRRNRTFFCVAGEQEHLRGQSSSDIDSAAVASINGVIAAHPAWHLSPLTTGLFPVTRAETELSGKITHQLTDAHSLMLRYAFTNNREGGDAFNTSALVDRSARGNSFTRDNALVGSLASVFSPKVVNDVRFQFAWRDVTLRTNAQSGAGIDVAGIAIFTRPYGGNGTRTETHRELSDNVSWSVGSHLLKAGAIANNIGVTADMRDGSGGIFVFPDLASFISGNPAGWRQSFGQTATEFGVTFVGGYVQDHWTPRWARRLTIDTGLRYDVERLPGAFHTDSNNFAPRLGIAYSPAKDWVVRAGYGIFYDRIPLASLNRALQLNGTTGFEQILADTNAATLFAADGGASLASPLPGVKPSVYRAEPGLATPYSAQVSLVVERSLDRSTTVSATFLNVHGVKLPRTVNINLLPPVTLTAANGPALGFASPGAQQLGRLVFGPGRIDQNHDAVYQLQDRASSTYNGVSLALNRRFADEMAFSASYTLSKALDDESDFDEQPQNPYDLHAERALSRNDQRHRFVFSGVFELFGDEDERAAGTAKEKDSFLREVFGNLEFAPILSIESGRPANALVGFDANHSAAWPYSSRPLGMARNTLRTPMLANLDFRLVKYIAFKPHSRLDLVTEFFNVLNRRNVTAINPVFGPGVVAMPDFGRPVDASRSRQIQFSLDFEF